MGLWRKDLFTHFRRFIISGGAAKFQKSTIEISGNYLITLISYYAASGMEHMLVHYSGGT